jgi:WhiB family redox-sensing transcriptional regulator
MPYDDNIWMDDAQCKDVEDPEIFFPPRDKTLYKKIAAEAKVYCFGGKTPEGKSLRACPVRKDCLLSAINEDQQHGIFGGLSHRERNALVRKYNRKYQHDMDLEEFILTVDTRAQYGYKQ